MRARTPCCVGSITHLRDRQSRSAASSEAAVSANPKRRLSASSTCLLLPHDPIELWRDQPGLVDMTGDIHGRPFGRECDEAQGVVDDERIFLGLVLVGDDAADR